MPEAVHLLAEFTQRKTVSNGSATPASAGVAENLSIVQRKAAALRIRSNAAEAAHYRQHPIEHVDNGAEAEATPPGSNLPTYAENFSKGLPHFGLDDPRPGEVRPEAYALLLKALATKGSEDFNKIPSGTPNGRKLTSPQSGLAFDLEGPDGQALTMPPAPQLGSIDGAGEIIELYWMAYFRDLPFDVLQGGSDNSVCPELFRRLDRRSDAISELRKFPRFHRVSRDTLFRSDSSGSRVGPYLSQFLLIGNNGDDHHATDGFITYGSQRIDQRHRVAKAKLDYLTDEASWLDSQNGVDAVGRDAFEPARRFLWTPRDLATYVHFDQLYQAYLNACLYMLAEKKADVGAPDQQYAQVALTELQPQKVNAFPFAEGLPYTEAASRQLGFATFGGPHILSLVTEVATRALKAVWYQKWFVHRRLRPEVFGARIHFTKNRGDLNYGLKSRLLDSIVLDLIKGHNAAQNNEHGRGTDDSYLLPQAFPEGSPTHPAYGAGHATVAAACVTILKAWFKDGSWPVPAVRVKPGTNSTKLEEIADGTEFDMTVHGELNKVAANIAIGRNMAGVHYLTDYTESRTLGEQVAIGILQEQVATYTENPLFRFNLFSGRQSVTIEKGACGQGVVTYGPPIH